jgi:hypothetical protein
MNLLIFILVCLGVTNIIVREHIFLWLRNFIGKWFQYSLLNKMINCEVCMGFWVGVFFSFMFPIQHQYDLMTMLMAGSAASGSIKLIYLTLYKF